MVKRYIFWNYLSPRRNSRRLSIIHEGKNLIRRSVSDENIKHFCVSLRVNARYSYVYQSVNVIGESLRNDFMEKAHIYKYDISHSERQLVKQRLIVLYENWNRSAHPRTTREIVKICAQFYPPKCVSSCPVWSLPSHCAPRHLHTTYTITTWRFTRSTRTHYHSHLQDNFHLRIPRCIPSQRLLCCPSARRKATSEILSTVVNFTTANTPMLCQVVSTVSLL